LRELKGGDELGLVLLLPRPRLPAKGRKRSDDRPDISIVAQHRAVAGLDAPYGREDRAIDAILLLDSGEQRRVGLKFACPLAIRLALTRTSR